MIRETDMAKKCQIYGSSLRRKWFKSIGCIQPECENYFGRKTVKIMTITEVIAAFAKANGKPCM